MSSLLGIANVFTLGVPIRLVGGNSYNEGRVEVYYYFRWGTVCDDGWDDTDAGVVCRQLGFGSSGTAINSDNFGQGLGYIWLANVACTGSESTLIRCGHPGVGITNCYRYEQAGVKCSGEVGKDLVPLVQIIYACCMFTLLFSLVIVVKLPTYIPYVY